MESLKSINKVLGDTAKFYQGYLTERAPSDFKYHLSNGIDRLVEENAELREMLSRDKTAFINQIELDLIGDPAKQETRDLAESIDKLLAKHK